MTRPNTANSNQPPGFVMVSESAMAGIRNTSPNRPQDLPEWLVEPVNLSLPNAKTEPEAHAAMQQHNENTVREFGSEVVKLWLQQSEPTTIHTTKGDLQVPDMKARGLFNTLARLFIKAPETDDFRNYPIFVNDDDGSIDRIGLNRARAKLTLQAIPSDFPLVSVVKSEQPIKLPIFTPGIVFGVNPATTEVAVPSPKRQSKAKSQMPSQLEAGDMVDIVIIPAGKEVKEFKEQMAAFVEGGSLQPDMNGLTGRQETAFRQFYNEFVPDWNELPKGTQKRLGVLNNARAADLRRRSSIPGPRNIIT